MHVTIEKERSVAFLSLPAVTPFQSCVLGLVMLTVSHRSHRSPEPPVCPHRRAAAARLRSALEPVSRTVSLRARQHPPAHRRTAGRAHTGNTSYMITSSVPKQIDEHLD